MHAACKGGNLDIVKYLAEELRCDFANKGVKDLTPIHVNLDICI